MQAPAAPAHKKATKQSSLMSLNDKQLMALEKRQKLFKEAALQVKFCPSIYISIYLSINLYI